MSETIPVSPQRPAGEATPPARQGRRLRLPAGLPTLSGSRLRLFRAVWLTALAAAVLGLLGSVYEEYGRSVAPRPAFSEFGLGYTILPLRLVVYPGGPAARAGLETGDVVVRVNGKPIRDDGEPKEIAELLSASGATVRLHVHSPGGKHSDHLLTRSAAEASRYDERTFYWTYIIADAVSMALLLTVAIILFRRRPHDAVAATLSLSFLLLAGGVAFPMLLDQLGLLSKSVNMIAFWFLLAVAVGAFGSALFAFPDGRFAPPWTRWAVLLLPLLSLVWIPPLILGPLALVQRYRSLTDAAERQQIKWAVLGFAVGSVLILASIPLALWAGAAGFGQSAETILRAAWTIGFALLGAGILVSLLRYRLYDVDTVISRSAAWALIMVVIAAAWAGVKTGIEKGFENTLGETSGAAAAGFLVALAAVIGRPAFERIHRWTEARFHKALIHLRRDLPLCVGDMRETAALAELLDEVLARIAVNVSAVRAAVVLRCGADREVAAVRQTAPELVEGWCRGWLPDGDPSVLECDRGDEAFPLRLKLRLNEAAAEPIGWILLGPRPDGSFYGRDEQEALAAAADPIARAVQIVRLREAREAELRGAIAALSRRLASIEERRRKPRKPGLFGGLEAGG